MDLYRRHLRKDASQKSLVLIGRILTLVFVVIGCTIAPRLADERFQGVFHYIQEFQGYISPGILAAFVFGFVVKRTPAVAGNAALILTVPIYGFLYWKFNEIAFLNRMAITFIAVLLVMGILTLINPLAEPKEMPVRDEIELKTSRLVLILGGMVILSVIAFYIIFW